MNLLMLTNHLNRGGISTYVVSVAKALEGRGHRVWVASRGGELEGEVKHRLLRITGKNAFSIQNLSQLRELKRIIEEVRPDVIWAHTRITMVLSELAYRFWGLPYITTFHGFFRPNLGRKLVKAAGERAIAISEAVRRHMVRDLKIPEEKVELVYNSLPDDHLRALKLNRIRLRSIAKDHLGVPEEVFLVGSLSRINPAKGYQELVAAVERLPADVWLVIVGQGGERESEWLRKVLEKSVARDRIRWLPYLPDVSIFWSGIDAFVLPSHKEGFGLALLEAMACGIPTIATRSGGPEELLGEELADLLIDVGDYDGLAKAIDRLKEDKAFYREVEEKVEERASRFKFGEFVNRVEQIILNVSKNR